MLYAPSPSRRDSRRSPPHHPKRQQSPAGVLLHRKPKFLPQPSCPPCRPLRHEDPGLLPDEKPRAPDRRTSVRGFTGEDSCPHALRVRKIREPHPRAHRPSMAKPLLFMPDGSNAPAARHAVRGYEPSARGSRVGSVGLVVVERSKPRPRVSQRSGHDSGLGGALRFLGPRLLAGVPPVRHFRGRLRRRETCNSNRATAGYSPIRRAARVEVGKNSASPSPRPPP